MPASRKCLSGVKFCSFSLYCLINVFKVSMPRGSRLQNVSSWLFTSFPFAAESYNDVV